MGKFESLWFCFVGSPSGVHSRGFSQGHQMSTSRVPHQTPDLLRWSLAEREIVIHNKTEGIRRF